MGEMKNALEIWVGKPERKSQIESPWRRLEGNITLDLMEIGWKGVDWFHVAQDRTGGRLL
jgi:hypothetical protein